MNIFVSILLSILLFSFLVVIHELGHFVAAKLSGVQVNEFSIFMGPAIFKKKGKETLYAIRCIPFGGYCMMEGEDEESSNPRAFGAAAWWKRLIILLSGAFMNFIIGVLLVTIVYLPANGIRVPVITGFTEQSQVSGETGLQVGDRFLEIDGEKIYSLNDVTMFLQLNPSQPHDLLVERNGQRVKLENFDMRWYEVTNPDGTTKRMYGMNFESVEELDFGGKLTAAWNTSKDYARAVRLSLKMLFSGQAGLKDMSGPVGVVQQMSQTAGASKDLLSALLNLCSFGGLIAINLAIMNLLPLPALDGGRAVCLLLTAAVEKITGKKINAKYEAYLHGAGMILLLILMAVITFKDIFTVFKG